MGERIDGIIGTRNERFTKKIPFKTVSEQKGLDNEIKGIKIIEVEICKKYIEGGEILTVFSYMESCNNFSV